MACKLGGHRPPSLQLDWSDMHRRLSHSHQSLRSQYLRPSSGRCARWAQLNFQLHSSWIWIDPLYNYGSFCNLPVQRSPPLSDGGSASLNFCWVLLLGCDWFLGVCCYCGHKKSFYNILIHFYICIVIWACICLLVFVVALTRKLVQECLICAFSWGLFSHSAPYNLYRQKIWSSFGHLATRNLAIKMLHLTLGMSLLQKLQVSFLNQSFLFLFFQLGISALLNWLSSHCCNLWLLSPPLTFSTCYRSFWLCWAFLGGLGHLALWFGSKLLVDLVALSLVYVVKCKVSSWRGILPFGPTDCTFSDIQFGFKLCH